MKFVPTRQQTVAPTRALSARSGQLRSNVIRDMLRIATQPDMIALGGGNPAPESFPLDIMPDLMRDVIHKYSAGALQYSDTEGFAPLREALSQWLFKQGIPADAEHIIVTAGSQSALDLLAKLLINENARVIVEQPTYLGALQAFSLFSPCWQSMSEDEDGPLPQHLDGMLNALSHTHHPALTYVMPTFRNPTGTSWSPQRLAELTTVLRRNDGWIVEDDPYRLLRYEGTPSLPIKTMLPEQTAYIGTLSKVFAPGLRLGYCVVPRALKPWLVKAKQATDLNTGTLSQALAAQYIQSGRLDENLPEVVRIYREKRDILAEALRKVLPDSFHFELPKGGMFLWVKGPPGFDSDRFLTVAIRHGVFFVPGSAFSCGATAPTPEKPLPRDANSNCMRLNFSGNSKERLRLAATRLQHALDEFLK